ncbi:MAG: ABC transporter ATP-binding protein [Clostridia bacterium]|nr:ABC transporter ATP-binding protein [Clostridia bacterium]
MEKLLEISGVNLTYQSKTSETVALSDLDLEILDNEFVSIVGPSGCGKTTILSLVAGLLSPTKGEIVLNGEKVKGPTTRIGYMFQRDNLFEWLTIQKNVTLGLSLQKKKTQENIDYTNNLITKYGLGDFKKHTPKELSGGMRQRVALIRTLATRPELLLLDEPFSALDYQTRLLVQDDVYKIIKSENKSAILVTHDISEAIAMSDKVVILTQRPGKVKTIVNLNFNKTLTPFERRNQPEFMEYFNQIWKELQYEE